MAIVVDAVASLTGGAHHESGHIVVAAASGLRLRPEGICIDPSGFGLACYYREPDGSDVAYERIILASFAGFYAEQHFRQTYGYSPRDDFNVRCSSDWREARKTILKLSDHYLCGETLASVQVKLEHKSKQLVLGHWPAIADIAAALLEKQWETIRPLDSGARWSNENETRAKYLVPDEIIERLARYGINAVVLEIP
jgi:hypothetical protein